MLCDQERYLKEIVARARDLLRTKVHCSPELRQAWGSTQFDEKHFEGKCGLAQCIIGYHLQQGARFDNQQIRPFASQSLQNWWYGHVALVVEGKQQLFLIDPTFAQFNSATGSQKPTPADFLKTSERGTQVLSELLEHGVVALAPAGASAYTSALCAGETPFGSDEAAFEFLKNPPSHELHYAYARGDDRFNPKKLRTDGLYLDRGF